VGASFVQGGGSLPAVSLTATDTGDLTAVDSITPSISAQNDAPLLTGDLSASVFEGGAYDIITTDLGYTDEDDDDSGVTFTVSDLTNGNITVNGNVATSFTGTELVAGSVSFVHDGSETTSASFNVQVEDGDEDASSPVTSEFTLSVTSINDAPNAVDDNGTVLLENGLYGSYYAYQEGQDGDNLENLNVVRDFIANNTANAHFIASDLDYTQVNDDLGKNNNSGNSNLQTFLGGVGGDSDTLSSVPATSSDGILHFTGKIDLSAGSYNFKVNADDGYTILIDGVEVATVFEKQDVTLTIHDSFTVANGSNGSLHDIEIIYWDQGITAVLKVELRKDSGDYDVVNSENFTIESPYGYSANKGKVFTVNATTLLANDTDTEGDVLTVVGVGNASDGASVSLDNGIVTLTPTIDFSGFVTFDYTVSDGTDTSTATVTVEYFKEFSAEDDRDIVTASNIITGNVITGEGGDGTGEDNLLLSNGNVSTVNFNGVDYLADVNGNITINGNHGDLVLSEDGAYTYTANLSSAITFGDVQTVGDVWTINKNSWDKTELYGFTGGTSFLNNVGGINYLDIANANVSNGNDTPKFQYSGPSGTDSTVGTLGINEDNTTLDTVNEFYLIDQRNFLAEALAVKLQGGANEINVTFDNVDADDEITWKVYDEDFKEVGQGETSSGQNTLTISVDGSVVTSEFSYILFTADDNSDDYGINNITYTPVFVEDIFTYTLTNDNGDTDTATLTVTHSQQGSPINDMLVGTSNDDVIIGNAGDDNITSGAGDDILIGGAGDDTLIGGVGADTFIWQEGDAGIDHIEDFTLGVDVIDISDILQLSNGDNLNDFLDFESDGTDTTINIFADGGSTITQTIVLDDVDLGSNDVNIINDMLTGTNNGGSLFIGDSGVVNTVVIESIPDETN
jgi:hypothetical protein